jgi:hypothetical protein
VSEKWEFAGSGAQCAACQGAIAVESPFCSALCFAPEAEKGTELVRRDYCLACGEKRTGEDAAPAAEAAERVIAFWRSVRAPREAPRRGYVKLDLDVVWQIFSGMPEDTGTGIEAELRYVLALMLLRRRRLELGKSGGGMLEFREKKSDRIYRVADPVLGEERIAELTARLGELLWEREFTALENQ